MPKKEITHVKYIIKSGDYKKAFLELAKHIQKDYKIKKFTNAIVKELRDQFDEQFTKGEKNQKIKVNLKGLIVAQYLGEL